MSDPGPAVLLDLDGTLIDSQPGILASCRAALRVLGHEPPPHLDITAIIGPPIRDVMAYLLAPYRDPRVEEAVIAYRKDYGETGLFASELYPGIADAVRAMREAGARLYLATSKRTDFARRILENLALDSCFEAIQGSEPDGSLDHKPELIAHILSRYALAKSRCVMVGDRRYDVSGAHANGVRAIGVLWGYGTRDELEAAGVDRLIDSVESLADTALAMADGRKS